MSVPNASDKIKEGLAGGEPPKVEDNPTPPAIEDKAQQTIPKHRFDEVYGKMKEAQDKVAAYEAAEATKAEELAAQELEHKKETQQYEELYNTTNSELTNVQGKVTTLEAKVGEYETTIGKIVESELAQIDEKYHSLIPESMTAAQKLDWINNAKNTGLFASQKVEIGKPTNVEQPRLEPRKMSTTEKIKAGLTKTRN